MADFVHLHVHSDYSLLNSTSTIEQIVGFAAREGMGKIALTDMGNLFGAVKFYKACADAGVGGIIGCDFYHHRLGRTNRTASQQDDLARTLLLAKDAEGYRSLVELSTLAYTEGFYYRPRIDDELLERYSAGLIAVCGGERGDVGIHIRANRREQTRERVGFYLEVFGRENFYLGLQDHGTGEEKLINDEMLRLSKEYTVGVVATNNTYYTAQDDAEAHNVLLCIGRRTRTMSKGMILPSDQFYLKSAGEMKELFRDNPEAISNAVEIAERCNFEMEFPGAQMPDFEIPKEFSSPEGYLRHLAEAGLARRYPGAAAETGAVGVDSETDAAGEAAGTTDAAGETAVPLME